MKNLLPYCLAILIFGSGSCAVRQNHNLSATNDLNDFCPGGEVFVSSGIECCIERVSQDQCEVATRELPAFMFVEIENIKKMTFPYQRGPNCHWTTLRYFDPRFSEPEHLTLIDQKHVNRLIESKKLQEITPAEAQNGDIVLYADRSEVRMPDINEHGRMVQRKSTLTNSIAHTGILVGDSLVFSKEDASSTRFTIDTKSNLEKIWLNRLQKHSSVVRAKLEIHYYRPASSDLAPLK